MTVLTCYEAPVYVSVWFIHVVLKDCIILSYVSELCSIMLFFFLLHLALLSIGLLYSRCIIIFIIMSWSKKHFPKDNHTKVNLFTSVNKVLEDGGEMCLYWTLHSRNNYSLKCKGWLYIFYSNKNSSVIWSVMFYRQTNALSACLCNKLGTYIKTTVCHDVQDLGHCCVFCHDVT